MSHLTGRTAVCQLLNGDFELGSNNKPSSWSNTSWQTNGVTFSWEPGSQDGSHCACIYNESSNDSRWIQTIQLSPGKVYLISGFIKGENISQGTGANICIDGTWTNSGSLYGTFGWKKVQFLYNVPDGQSSVTIGCRLGYWSSLVTGKAWFDDIKVEESLVIEGNHIVLSFFPDMLSGVNVQSIVGWINNLDQVYEKYLELVGEKPYSGSKIYINPDFSNPNWWAVAGNPILWNSRYINSELKSIDAKGDWSFGILHELGHDFDLDYKWVWNAEMLANFKMIYVNEQLNATVYQNTAYVGGDIRKYYQSKYNEVIAKDSLSWDAVTFLFTQIVDSISWEPFKKTFRAFNLMPNSEVPKTEYQKFKMFMNILSLNAGRNVLSFFREPEFEWIRRKLSKVKGMYLSKHDISLNVNESTDITATFSPPDTPDKSILWSVGDSSVCKIEGNVITALSCGSTYIYATSREGDFVDSCQISVTNYFYVTENKNICEGQSYKGHTLSGIYVENLKTVFGCDSIITTQLIVNPVYDRTESVSICEGATYKGHAASGTYVENL
ncbi:MAG: M60 family metallopeptidase, partial [Bacteroidota bacterium]|nr:M60 family metallopeptidase [Bacteroidota bacterium]